MCQPFTCLNVQTGARILRRLTLGQNIRKARERAGHESQGDGAKALGWSQSRLSDVENDRYGSMDSGTILHIAKTFKSSTDDLFIGLDRDFDDVIASLAPDDVEPGFLDVSGHLKEDIPVITEGEASPQGGLFWDDTGQLKSDVEDRITRPYDVKDPRAYGVKVRGDSMFPAYKPGMTLVVSPNTPVGNGDEVYVQLLNGERLIKVARRSGDGWLLESINPAYEARFITKAEIGAMHPVMWSRRKR